MLDVNKFCPECGTAVTGAFCANCGTAQATEQPVLPPSQPVEPTEDPVPVLSMIGHGMMQMFSCGSIIASFLALFVAGLMFSFLGASEDTAFTLSLVLVVVMWVAGGIVTGLNVGTCPQCGSQVRRGSSTCRECGIDTRWMR